MAGKNGGGVGTIIITIVLLLLVGMLGSSCISTCSGKKSTVTATEKEKQTAQWLGEHGYFDKK